MMQSSTNHVLFIGLVWPEPTSSAAGYRIVQLVNLFVERGYQVTFVSAAQKTERSYHFPKEVKQINILLNNETFDELLLSICPNIVVYDRFMIEEQYGWRVRKNCPKALTILDTEDLHFVRKAREESYKKNTPLNLHTTEAKRELASILRTDVSLLISSEEIKILADFNIPPSKIVWLPFVERDNLNLINLPGFHERQDFCFIGNFIHEPNYQTVKLLKSTYWPCIRKKKPKANLYIYGSYPTQKVWNLHQPKDGFYVIGAVDDVNEVLQKHRVLIAPIPFGAGIKGKFVDGCKNKIPNVTTQVGAEAMFDEYWNGAIANQPEDFCNYAVKLYEDENFWNESVLNGEKLYAKYYQNSIYLDNFWQVVDAIKANVESHRNKHFLGEILFYEQLQATKYFSLWISEKNKMF
ncbi:MAG TPA: glycosyltransferase family 4 protein [Flavobacterium sp.]|nr:glycosyltransferase family 4 protein [Flavobacterium sp.]